MMLDDSVLSAPLLEHGGIDLESATDLTYVLDQRFAYRYDAPIRDLRHRLVVLPPPRHGNQHRRAHRLDVLGTHGLRRSTTRDRSGNVIVRVDADAVAECVQFRVAAVVTRRHSDGPTLLPVSALTQPRLLRPTRLTAVDDALRDLAHDAVRGLSDPLDRADALTAATYRAIIYEYGRTSVSTTAAQALAGGRGVCQDSAHVMLALCHAVALPARYVSGHLLGQGGTHAWVEAIVPHAGAAMAVALDPCNGRRAGNGYLTVATGRDYVDVAPTSGRYDGSAAGHLTTSRRVGLLRAA